jgi:hypothetical protein
VVQAFLFLGVVKIEELELYDKEEESRGWIDDKVKRVKFRLLGPLG